MTKKAKDIRMGDVILVKLHTGTVPKIVDRVQQDGDKVKITLYSPSGTRPVVTLHEDQEVQAE